MGEAQAVVEAYARAVRDGVGAALATVVCVEGSAYRRPGARMLMTADGQMTGHLSGGCLERDVFEHARVVMKTGRNVVVRYDTGASDDIVWGLGLGCNGVVHALIEALDGEAMPHHLELLSQCITRQESGVIATVFGVHPTKSLETRADEPEVTIGSRLLLRSDDSLLNEFSDAHLARAVARDARECLNGSGSGVKAYELATYTVEVFVELVEPPVPLVIFGANADAAPVAALAQQLGWHVTIVDTHARTASRERFRDADEVLLCRPEGVAAHIPLAPHTVVIVMTHNYLHDVELFKTLLPSPARYIGMLGPKRRTEQIISEAAAAGVVASRTVLQRLYAPVGLDLGAETPEEIALSIVAEIRAVLANHQGGFLKNRDAPIHSARPTREHRSTRTIVEAEFRAEALGVVSE